MDWEFVHKISDRELLVRVQQLAHAEQHATAALVAHLSEMERRQLYLEQGCRSLFTYCTQVLHLSEHAAYNRIEAARIALRFPAVLTRLAEGHVHLTAIRLLAPCLTAENQHELLTAAQHKSKREVEEIVARLRPRPDAATSVRKLPGPAVPQRTAKAVVEPAAPGPVLFGQPEPASAGDNNGGIANPGHDTHPATPGHAARPAAVAPKPANIVPLAPERYKVQFTANAATCTKLRRAQELLRHRIPSGDVAAVIDVALDFLVRDLEKKKFAATAEPRRNEPVAAAPPQRSGSKAATPPQRSGPTTAAGLQSSGPTAPGAAPGVPARAMDSRRAPAIPADSNRRSANTESRHIPAAVKRAVWQRDGGRCAFVGASGLRCTERGQLEFDHIRPHADGGAPTTDNVRLLCRQHNQHESHSFFGSWQAEGRDYSFQNESISTLAPGQVRTG